MSGIRIDKVYFVYKILGPKMRELLKAYFFKKEVPSGAQHVEIKTPNEVMAGGDWMDQEAMARAILGQSYATVLVGSETPEKMAYAISRQAYWDEVESEAQGIWDDIKSRHIENRNDLFEHLNGVTYSQEKYDVLRHTNNADACTRQHGMPLNEDDPVSDLAYWAYYQDVLDALCKLGCEPNKDKLGRCEDCDGHGYVEYSKNVIVRCAECEAFDSRREAIGQALEEKAIKRCNACDNFGCTVDGETVKRCEVCEVFDTDEEAAEFVMEHGEEAT